MRPASYEGYEVTDDDGTKRTKFRAASGPGAGGSTTPDLFSAPGHLRPTLAPLPQADGDIRGSDLVEVGTTKFLDEYRAAIERPTGATSTPEPMMGKSQTKSSNPTYPYQSGGSSKSAYTQYTNYGEYGQYGYSSYTAPPIGYVEVMDGAASMGRWSIRSLDRDWWDIAVKHYEVELVGSDKVLRIPKEKVAFSEGSVSFFACTYDAAAKLLESLFGRRLHEDDKRWLTWHPYATDEGIPTEYTATCLQGLVEPYGLRVSRVRVKPGTFTPGDEYTNWKLALGCNPFAMVDGRTTNAEAAQKLGMPLDQANALFRFEYADQPLPGSVVGRAGVSASTVTSGGVGNAGGHADYCSPRGGSSDWVISVQLDWADRVEYQTEPKMPQYHVDGTGRRRGPATLQLGSVKAPHSDAVIAVFKQGKYRTPAEAAALEKGGVAVATTFPGGPGLPGTNRTSPSSATGTAGGSGGTGSSGAGSRSGTLDADPTELIDFHQAALQMLARYGASNDKCRICQTMMALDDFIVGAFCCKDCATVAWEGYRCPKCDARLDQGNIPTIDVATGEATPMVRCPSSGCGSLFLLNKNDHLHHRLREAIAAYQHDLERFIDFDYDEPGDLETIEELGASDTPAPYGSGYGGNYGSPYDEDDDNLWETSYHSKR